jgi:hypothetical protein
VVGRSGVAEVVVVSYIQSGVPPRVDRRRGGEMRRLDFEDRWWWCAGVVGARKG